MQVDTTTAMTVDPGNEAQRQAWDGSEGAYWAAHADAYDASVGVYHQELLDAAALEINDRVLDVGCGTGQVTIDAARVTRSALGIDLSSAMLEVARQRAADAGLANASFLHGDAQVHAFATAEFDVVVSRTGAMFFSDPRAGFANLARATRPDGRLAILVWQPVTENEWFRAFTTALAAGRDLPAPPPGAPGPFSLSDPATTSTLLESTGWADVDMAGLARPMFFGPDADAAHDFILGQLGWLVADLPDDQRSRAVDALHQVMRDHETPDGVLLGSAAWLVTARREGAAYTPS